MFHRVVIPLRPKYLQEEKMMGYGGLIQSATYVRLRSVSCDFIKKLPKTG